MWNLWKGFTSLLAISAGVAQACTVMRESNIPISEIIGKPINPLAGVNFTSDTPQTAVAEARIYFPAFQNESYFIPQGCPDFMQTSTIKDTYFACTAYQVTASEFTTLAQNLSVIGADIPVNRVAYGYGDYLPEGDCERMPFNNNSFVFGVFRMTEQPSVNLER